MDKFVDEWNIVESLGEGAYAEVKLLMNQQSRDVVAMKIIDLTKNKDAKECVAKEVKIHRLLVHPNIIRFLGKREEPTKIYLFLEHAPGGELFNRIEPDVGMHPRDAQRYMRQLLQGVHFLHTKGVVHRDIKPENILLDARDTLKICDFGLATIFKLKGRVRLLDKKCGTYPYVAPEVFLHPYKGEPADIWSCGMVLLAMLAGELPWDDAKDSNPEFSQWKKHSCVTKSPWSKLTFLSLSLVRKILTPDPKARLTINGILQSQWMNVNLDTAHLDEIDSKSSMLDDSDCSFSQPIAAIDHMEPEHLATVLQSRDHNIPFSQPTINDDLFINSEMQFTQNSLSQNDFHRLIKRMTRFFVKTNHENTITQLCKALDKLHYNWTCDASGLVTISTLYNRKYQLVFKANIMEMEGQLLLDFRFSKGCGLEFKRCFIKIKAAMSEVISTKQVDIFI